MSEAAYLRRHGIEPDVEIDALDLEQAVEYAVELAYYQACLSDPTYHGVDRDSRVSSITRAVNYWPQFDPDDFATLDRAAGQVIRHRRASSAGTDAVDPETAIDRAVAECRRSGPTPAAEPTDTEPDGGDR